MTTGTPEPTRPKRLFINFRREDCGETAARLHERLDQELPGQVFIDEENIEGGSLWADRIKHEISTDDAVLALIGPSWLKVEHRNGGVRLHRDDDWVRYELATALRRLDEPGFLLQALLVRGASMPEEAALPPDLRRLLLSGLAPQPLRTSPKRDWDHDIDFLIDKLLKRGFRRQRQPLSGSGLPRVLGGRFELQELLGQGGFSDVWRARDTEQGRTVAVKVLHWHHGRSPERIERFTTGARQMRAMDHPNIVRVLTDAAEQDGLHWFAMEFVDGTDLRSLVTARGNGFDRAARLKILQDVAAALDYAHTEHKVVHRDVKPANILVGKDGRARLTDFDLVKVSGDTQLTVSLGDVLFGAPEILAEQGAPSPASDIYSFARVALYTLSGGKLPGRARETLESVLTAAGVNGPAGESVRGALSNKPEERTGSAGALVRAVVREYTPEEIRDWEKQASRATVASRGWIRVLGAVLALLLAGALAPFGYKWWRSMRAERLESQCQELLAAAKGLSQGQLQEVRRWMRMPHADALREIATRAAVREALGGRVRELRRDFDSLGPNEPFDGDRRPANVKEPLDQLEAQRETLPLAAIRQRLDAIQEREAECQRAWTEFQAEVRAGGTCYREPPAQRLALMPMVWRDKKAPRPFLVLGTGTEPKYDEASKRWVLAPESGMVAVLLPGGEFLMGAQKLDPTKPGFDEMARDNESPVTRELRPFYVAVHECTEAWWGRLMDGGSPPSLRPKAEVSWDDASLFCALLGGSLPREAEWEYACRGGTATRYWSGQELPDLARVAWYDGNSEGRAHDVGEKPANAFGLFDIHGNLWEWCDDLYGPYESAGSAPESRSGSDRVVRGGSWNSDADRCRSAYRYGFHPAWHGDFLGFRVAWSGAAP